MKLVGYSDRLSVAQGETVRFMVSSQHASYTSELVRLIHGDENPEGPGFKERRVPSAIDGVRRGREQVIRGGSYAIVADDSALRPTAGFTLTAWIYATTPRAGPQGLMTRWSPRGPEGFGLFIDTGGDLAVWLGDGARIERYTTGSPLRSHEWYFVAASYEAASSRVVLYQAPVRRWPIEPTRAAATREAAVRPGGATGCPLIMAGRADGGEDRLLVSHLFNGRIDRPRVFGRALTHEEIARLEVGADPADLGNSLVAAWDFSLDMSSDRITDTSGRGLHGQTVNLPTRAMPGYNWSGKTLDFKQAPDQYGAIHFHADDLEDAGWEVDFELTVPRNLPSGVYAARLRAGESEDYLPFFVRPAQDAPTARIALLFPTLHYLTYANFRDLDLGAWDQTRAPNADPDLHPEEFRYIRQNQLFGLYDFHVDGSGVCYGSRRQPILNMRPKFRYRVWSAPARFPADLYLVDWLEAKGIAADVITDDDLHAEGQALLAPYRVVITGSHHEYWTAGMLDAIEAYLDSGGRLMYLGGNGFFGVTSVHPEKPHVIEVRRWGTSWPFELPPGERYHSTTGELGGTWRNRGRAPQRILGVGTSAAGFDRGTYYVRQPASFDPRAAFIFEGIGDDERIGDIPSLVMRHGAAGYEMDRADRGLGTPPHALLLASSVGHSAVYDAMLDEQLAFRAGPDGIGPSTPPTPGTVHPFIRADMVYFETANGGAVFSVGSIGWRSCLSYNTYENTVSRVTENVLRRFVLDDPLP
jgi:N,N-dimethylformamidase